MKQAANAIVVAEMRAMAGSVATQPFQAARLRLRRRLVATRHLPEKLFWSEPTFREMDQTQAGLDDSAGS
ncbi:MAG: hypothetical protein WCP77_14995 [Roseococcus sp.]